MREMRTFRECRSLLSVLAAVLGIVVARGARAATDYEAISSGIWEISSTWSPMGVPGSSDYAFIGSNEPEIFNSAGTASVTLAADQEVYDVYVGYFTGTTGTLSTSGTLDLGGYTLTANQISIGQIGASGTIIHDGGSFSTPYLNVYSGNSLALAANDTISTLATLDLGAQLTTASSGNIAYSLTLSDTSTLTLGAPLVVSGIVDVEQYSTLNAAGYPISAYTVDIGANFLQPVTLLGLGPITAEYLNVGGQAFNLSASDTVANLVLKENAQVATVTTGNVTSTVTVSTSSTLTLGASLSLAGALDVEDSSTLNMAGYPVSVSTLDLGWNDLQAVMVVNRGPITATNLNVASEAFNLSASDSVTNFSLKNNASTALCNAVSVYSLTLSTSSQATTSAAGNVTNGATLSLGSTLTLGAPLTLSGVLDLEQSATLNMAGYPVSAATVDIGSNDLQPVSVTNRGPITAAYLTVAAQTFNLNPSDMVSNLTLINNAQTATAAAGNITSSVTLNGGSMLTLGASMTLSGILDLEQSSTLSMAGYPVSAATVEIGSKDVQPVNVLASGAITTNYLYVGGGSTLTLTSGSDTVNTQINVSGNSVLAVQPAGGLATGLTLQATSSTALDIDNTSVLNLTAGSVGQGWLFRWQDPGNRNWDGLLSGLIAAGRISVTGSAGYSIFNEGAYTYIGASSTLEWNGAGSDNNWSNAANWGGATPLPGQWLRFGPLAPGGHAANFNDIAGNPLFYGIFFDSQAPSYNLQGNPIRLSGNVFNQSGNNQEISLDLQLVPGSGAFNTNTIAFDTGGETMTLAGSISGLGMGLEETGGGTLILSGTGAYTGGTAVAAGTLIVDSSTAIADGTDLTVGADAASIFDVAAARAPAAVPVSPVPEPGSLSLIILAVGGAGVYRRVGRSLLPGGINVCRAMVQDVEQRKRLTPNSPFRQKGPTPARRASARHRSASGPTPGEA
jgi:fibronectin-binding autotransporter adhesin